MIAFQSADELVCQKRSNHNECLFAVAVLTAFFWECCNDSSFIQIKQKDLILTLCLCSTICLLFMHYKSNLIQKISFGVCIGQLFSASSSLMSHDKMTMKKQANNSSTYTQTSLHIASKSSASSLYVRSD